MHVGSTGIDWQGKSNINTIICSQRFHYIIIRCTLKSNEMHSYFYCVHKWRNLTQESPVTDLNDITKYIKQEVAQDDGIFTIYMY